MEIRISSAGNEEISPFNVESFGSDSSLRGLAQISVTRGDARYAWPLAGAAHELITAVDLANQKLGENKVVALVHSEMAQRIAAPHRNIPFGLTYANGIVIQAGEKQVNFSYTYGGIEDWFDACIAKHDKRENKLHYDCGFPNQGPEKLADIFVKLARGEPLLPPTPIQRMRPWEHVQNVLRSVLPRPKGHGLH